jgi:hypothetical protein
VGKKKINARRAKRARVQEEKTADSDTHTPTRRTSGARGLVMTDFLKLCVMMM